MLSGHVMVPGLFQQNLPPLIPLHPSIPLSFHPSPFSLSSSSLPVLQRVRQRLPVLWGENGKGEGVIGWKMQVVG